MASLGNIYLKFGADVSALNAGFADVQKQLGGLGKSISSMGTLISGAFAGLSIGQVAIDAIKMSAAIESSFLKIKNLTDTSANDLKYFKENLAGISSQVGKSQKELSEGLYAITSSGLVGKEALDALKVASQASAIGLGDTETIARSLTAVMNAYGKENISAQRTAEVLFQTLKFGKLEASELAPALGRILPTSQVLGVSFEQVGAAIAQMSLSGANASESVTNLRSIMAALIAPSELANKTLARYGLTMEEVRQRAREDLSKALIFLNERLGGNTEAINDVLGRQEAFTGFFSVVGQNASNYGKIVQGITQDTNDFAAASDEVAKSFQGRYDRAVTSISNNLSRFGDILKNALVSSYEWLAHIDEYERREKARTTAITAANKQLSGQIALFKQLGGLQESTGGPSLKGIVPHKDFFKTTPTAPKAPTTKSPSASKTKTVADIVFNPFPEDILEQYQNALEFLPEVASNISAISTEGVEASASIYDIANSLLPTNEGLASFNEQLSGIISAGFGDSFTALGEQIGSALSGGKFNVGAVLAPLADMLINVGKLAIGTGIAIEGIKAALKSLNPIAAIAGGIALVALGSFVKTKLSGSTNKFAKGVLSYGEHTGTIGDNPNARFDPEVTAPSSKLRSLFESVTLPNLASNLQGVGSRSFQPIELSFSNTEFRVSGNDLVLVLDRNKAIQSRQRAF